jgi:N6-adenosine-specific RNA methylase IME4
MKNLALVEKYCELTKTSLKFRRDVTKAEWASVFKALREIEGSVQFWIGDCLAYREQRWGMYDDMIQETGYEKGSLRYIKLVAEKIESARRRADLTFSHHLEVVKLSPEKQDEYLEKAALNNLTVKDLRRLLRRDGVIYNSESELPEGIFQLFYADPPWKYGTEFSATVPEDYYPTMEIEEICALPIDKMTDTNAVLFMWTTTGFLESSFDVVHAWGFEYKTCFIWDKVKHNVGPYSSVRHEILLLCTKGTYPIQNLKFYDSVYSEEKTEHSKKPDFYYQMIEDLYPNTKKLELFARNKRDGWTSFGNQN